MKRKNARITAAIEAKEELTNLIVEAWHKGHPEWRRGYLRGLMLLEDDAEILSEGKWLMEICNNYGR